MAKDKHQTAILGLLVTILAGVAGTIWIALKLSYDIGGWVKGTEVGLHRLTEEQLTQSEVDREHDQRITRVETMSQRDWRERQRNPRRSEPGAYVDISEDQTPWDPER